MQPTTHETISESTLTGVRKVGRPGVRAGLRGGLRAGVAYGFVILALCLMIADFCRLTRTPETTPFAASTGSHSTRL
jgi:hypothetical protein